MTDGFESDSLHAKRLEQYRRAGAEAEEIFARKNRQYGDAISKGGVLGAIQEFHQASGRFAELFQKRLPICLEDLEDGVDLLPKAELIASLRETALDAINYGHIILMLIEDDNFLGR